jgi:formylglycine-generating enzyme required for sulfatase activity
VMVLTALSVTRGLFLGLVGLGSSWLLGRDRLAAILGALFGFGLAFRDCTTALLNAAVGRPASLPDVAERLAMPGALPALRQLPSPDQALTQADLASLSAAVPLALAMGLLPAGVGALIGSAIAGRAEQGLSRGRRLSLGVAGAAALVGLLAIWWCGSASVLQARREMAELQARGAGRAVNPPPGVQPAPVAPKPPEPWESLRRSQVFPQSVPPKPPERWGPPPKVLPDLGLRFARVPRGRFWMGGGGGRPGDRQVEIPHDFELGVHEVTQGQWQALMGRNPSWFSRTGGGKDTAKDIPDAELAQFPVDSVSWDDAQEFLKRLNALKKDAEWTYRLPTEAEWEYACRGSASSKEDCSFDFYLERPTNDLSSEHANFNGIFPAGKAAKGPDLQRPAKVGSYQPNRLGIYDLHGNVWEWCQDSLDGGSLRVYRGGGWDVHGQGCRAANRLGWISPSFRRDTLGFRVALVPSGK